MFETQKIDSFFSGEKNLFEEEERTYISRRTKVVRFLKLFLPCLTAMLLGLGVVLFDFDTQSDSTLSIAEEEKLYFEKFRMKNTVFEITEKDNQFSILKAETIEEVNAGEKVYNLINPDAQTTDKSKIITLSSMNGYYDQNKRVLNLSNNVVANYNKQMIANTSDVSYNFSKEEGYGKNPIVGNGEKGKFKANSFSFSKKNSSITLIGDVELLSNDITLTTPNEATLFANDNKFVANNATAIKGKDRIKGDVLTVLFKDTKSFEIDKAYTDGKTEIYSGNKKATADKGEYLADAFISNLYGNVRIADPRGYIATAEKGSYNSKNKTFTLTNNVKIIKGNNTAFADRATYYQDKEEFHLFDNVRVIQDNTVASADKGVYFIKKNVAELEKNVVITRDGNMVKGDKAISDFSISKSRLIANNGGRISGKLIESRLGNKED